MRAGGTGVWLVTTVSRDGFPIQAIRLDSSFSKQRTHWRQARRSRTARATGAWLLIQRVLVVSGGLAWLVALGTFAAWVLGQWPQ